MLSACTSTPCSIHDLQTLRAEDVVPATASATGERRALDDLLDRDDAVRVHVDHSDAPATDHHLASRRLSLKGGGHARRRLGSSHTRRPLPHECPQERSAISHVMANDSAGVGPDVSESTRTDGLPTDRRRGARTDPNCSPRDQAAS